MILVSIVEQIFTLYSIRQSFLVISIIIRFHGILLILDHPFFGVQPRIWQIPATWLPLAAATMSSGEPRRNPRQGNPGGFYLVIGGLHVSFGIF